MGNLYSFDRDFNNFINRINQQSVGFGPIFRDFSDSVANYPPHNIVTISDTEFYIEIAVAGFKKDEIKITEQGSILSVAGDKSSDTPEYQYKGIAKRSFSKSFRIAEHYEIGNAELEDGILRIKYTKNAPSETIKIIAIQ